MVRATCRWKAGGAFRRWSSLPEGERVVTCFRKTSKRWTTSTRPSRCSRPNRASLEGCGCIRRRSAACPPYWPCGFCFLRWTTVRCHFRSSRKRKSGCVGEGRRNPCWPVWRGCARERCAALPMLAAPVVERSRGCWIGCASWQSYHQPKHQPWRAGSAAWCPPWAVSGRCCCRTASCRTGTKWSASTSLMAETFSVGCSSSFLKELEKLTVFVPVHFVVRKNPKCLDAIALWSRVACRARAKEMCR